MTKQTYWKKNWSGFTVPKNEFIMMKDAWKCGRKARRWETTHSTTHIKCNKPEVWNQVMNSQCWPLLSWQISSSKTAELFQTAPQLGTACSNVRAHGDTGLQTTTFNSRPHRLKATLSCKIHLINIKVYIIFPIQLEL